MQKALRVLNLTAVGRRLIRPDNLIGGMSVYYFFGDKVRPANAAEAVKIGRDDAEIWEGRLVIPIRAKNRETAWEKARAAVAEYEEKTGIKITSLSWTTYNPYNKLSELRSKAGLTQQALADAAGVNIRQVQKWESGELDIGKAAAETVVKVAKMLNTTVEDLLKAEK